MGKFRAQGGRQTGQQPNIVMLNVFVPFMGEFSDPSSPSPLMVAALNPYELLPYFVGDKCPWAIHIFHIVQ